MMKQKEELGEQRVWKPEVKICLVSQLMVLKRERMLKKSQKKRVLAMKVKRVQEKRTREAAAKRGKKGLGVKKGKVEEQGELRRES